MTLDILLRKTNTEQQAFSFLEPKTWTKNLKVRLLSRKLEERNLIKLCR